MNDPVCPPTQTFQSCSAQCHMILHNWRPIPVIWPECAGPWRMARQLSPPGLDTHAALGREGEVPPRPTETEPLWVSGRAGPGDLYLGEAA